MTPDRFPLAGLLRVRTLQKQRSEAELAAANRTTSGLRAQRIDTLAALANADVDSTGETNLAAAAASRAAAQTMLAELALLAEHAEQEAVAARDRHRAARADALAVEKLHERHVETVRVAELAAEQLALDEIALRSGREGAGA